jgi:hypothetical protein
LIDHIVESASPARQQQSKLLFFHCIQSLDGGLFQQCVNLSAGLLLQEMPTDIPAFPGHALFGAIRLPNEQLTQQRLRRMLPESFQEPSTG